VTGRRFFLCEAVRRQERTRVASTLLVESLANEMDGRVLFLIPPPPSLRRGGKGGGYRSSLRWSAQYLPIIECNDNGRSIGGSPARRYAYILTAHRLKKYKKNYAPLRLDLHYIPPPCPPPRRGYNEGYSSNSARRSLRVMLKTTLTQPLGLPKGQPPRAAASHKIAKSFFFNKKNDFASPPIGTFLDC
jgi:hypothetical protein